jgi:hypothetical protein
MRSNIFRTTAKMILAALLTVTVQAQQADALRMTVTQGVPVVLTKKEAKQKGIPAASPVIVEVRDTTNRIVPGARVEVDSPASPGKPLLGWTDTEGLAYIDGVVPTGQEGKVPIVVNARFNGMLGSATFNNNATLPPAPQIAGTFVFKKQDHHVRNILIIAGVVGLTALAIALALTLPGGSAPKAIPPTATSVSLGGIGVGAPQ